MTVISYVKKSLVADQCVAQEDIDLDTFHLGKKLFINRDKTMAIAFCGDIPSKKAIALIFDELLDSIMSNDMKNKADPVTAGYNFYAITRELVILGRKDCYVKIVNPKILASGTGGMFFRCAIETGMSIKDSMKFVSDNVRTCSASYDRVRHRDLRQFKEVI